MAQDHAFPRVRSLSMSAKDCTSSVVNAKIRQRRRTSFNSVATDLVAQLCALSLHGQEQEMVGFPVQKDLEDFLQQKSTSLYLWNLVSLHCWIHGKKLVYPLALAEGIACDVIVDQPLAEEEKRLSRDLLACWNIGLMLGCANSNSLEWEDAKEKTSKLLLEEGNMNELCIPSQLIRGIFHLLVADEEAAERIFNNNVEVFVNNVHAMIGHGILAFKRQKWSTALSCFRTALSAKSSDTEGGIRMAIGHCFLGMGHYEKAKAAYRKAMELDVGCTGAWVGMVAILLREEEEASFETSMGLIQEAYRMEPTNKMVHELLANPESVPDLVPSLYGLLQCYISGDKLKSELVYELAVRYHKAELYDSAFQRYYLAACLGGESFVLPHFGLGQMHLQRAEYGKTAECFEKVLKAVPDCLTAMKMLGHTYAAHDPDRCDIAAIYLKKVVEHDEKDVDSLTVLAGLLENTDKKASLGLYLKALDALRREKDPIPVSLYNNIASLYLLLADRENSYRNIKLAKRLLDSYSVKKRAKLGRLVVAVSLNAGAIARLRDDNSAAQALLEQALCAVPDYVETCIQLGLLALEEGDFEEGKEWLEMAVATEPENPTPRLQLAKMYLIKKERDKAREEYKTILRNPTSRNDSYTLLSLGSFLLEELQEEGLTVEERKRFAEQAFGVFRQVFSSDPTNIYAANGMAAVFCSTGFLEAGHRVLTVILENSPEIPDVWINVGHCCCDQKKYSSALEAYETAISLTKRSPPELSLLICAARASYLNRGWNKATVFLQKALRLDPGDSNIRFNLATTIKRAAVESMKNSRSDVKNLEAAREDMHWAQLVFERLLGEIVVGDVSADSHRAHKAVESCKNYINQSSGHLARAKREELEELQTGKRRIGEPASCRQRRKNSDSVSDPKESVAAERVSRKRDKEPAGNLEGRKHPPRAERSAESPKKKRDSRFAELDDVSLDDCDIRDQPVSAEDQAEPQRKRHRAVVGLIRRQKRVADRKRREQEIEKIALSSDEENRPVARYHRKKAGRGDLSDLTREKSSPKFQAGPSVSMSMGPPPVPPLRVAPVVTVAEGSFLVPRRPLRSSTEDDSPPTTTVSKHSTSENLSDDTARRTSDPSVKLRNQLKNVGNGSTENVAVDDCEKRKAVLDSDDNSKRVISDCEGKSRKRHTVI